MIECKQGEHSPDIWTENVGTYEQTKCLKCKKRIFKYNVDDLWMTDSEYEVRRITQGIDNEI